jgi:hypothetical protein
VAQMMTDVELNADLDFIENYRAALYLPNTDPQEFPSVKQNLNKNG